MYYTQFQQPSLEQADDQKGVSRNQVSHNSTSGVYFPCDAVIDLEVAPSMHVANDVRGPLHYMLLPKGTRTQAGASFPILAWALAQDEHNQAA